MWHGSQGGDDRSGAASRPPLNVSYGCNHGDSYPGTEYQLPHRGTGGACACADLSSVADLYWVPTRRRPRPGLFTGRTLLSEWQGNLFMGALAGTGVWRPTLAATPSRHREA